MAGQGSGMNIGKGKNKILARTKCKTAIAAKRAYIVCSERPLVTSK